MLEPNHTSYQTRYNYSGSDKVQEGCEGNGVIAERNIEGGRESMRVEDKETERLHKNDPF